MRFFDVTAADGTRLRAWTNDAEGPTVVLCNGLGTNAYCWPALLRPDCGVRVVSWNHRGVGGSERPSDPDAVDIEDFARDAVAVMDHLGIASAPMMGWSMGVNTIFEAAVSHPDRVDGLFAVGGVPGDTFASMLAPLGVPRAARKHMTVNAARLMKQLGGPLTTLARTFPFNHHMTAALQHSGFMLPTGETPLVQRAVREFLTTPIDWYMHLALHSSLHLRVSLSEIDVPTSFVAGTYDVLASAADMRTAAARTDGDYLELAASHFLPLEHPDTVHAALLELVRQSRRQAA
ncbi:alpha/beta hydrolase [Nocardioidaceae bacterium]|nr:alpha/beta hydrolase [Nocardioidaceae bacterium]